MSKEIIWNRIHYPILSNDPLPPERKVVLVWCDGKESDSAFSPYLGYIRYTSGCEDTPFFVVYHGNFNLPVNVIAWCDCLPDKGPEWSSKIDLYNRNQDKGRGFSARKRKKNNDKKN